MDIMTEDRIERMAERMMDALDRRLMTEKTFTMFAYNAEVKKLDAWVKEQAGKAGQRQ